MQEVDNTAPLEPIGGEHIAAPGAAGGAQTWRRLPVLALLLAGFLAMPQVFGNYTLHAMIMAMIFLLPALGLNLIAGYTGLLSLGQGAFLGVGAYTSALLAMNFGTPFYVNILAAGLVSALIALPLGIPALRLRSHSFVMCTLGLLVIAEITAKNWVSVTRGDMGLSAIPRPEFDFFFFSFTVTGVRDYFYLSLAVCVVMTAVCWALVNSAAGRAMVAIRENETLAESIGVQTWWYKLVVFTITAAFAGMGGSLYAHYLTVVSPLMFAIYYLITILVIVLGGGAGTIAGVVAGSFLFVGVSEALRVTPELRLIAYGLILVLLVFKFPRGIAPVFDWIDSRLTGHGSGGAAR